MAQVSFCKIKIYYNKKKKEEGMVKSQWIYINNLILL